MGNLLHGGQYDIYDSFDFSCKRSGSSRWAGLLKGDGTLRQFLLQMIQTSFKEICSVYSLFVLLVLREATLQGEEI